MSWKTITFKDRTYYDIIAEDAIIDPAIKKHLSKSNGCENEKEFKSEPFKDYILFDLPGMMMMDRYMFVYEFDGFKIKIPATDLTYMYKSVFKPLLNEKENFVTIQRMAYTIYMSMNTLEKLCQKISQDLIASIEIAKVENDEFDRRISTINKKSNVKIDTPRRSTKFNPFSFDKNKLN